ncbi:hypothetical protein N8813_04420 [bacterium]|nr:hypothetical protein [bacterium]MDC0321747.1 hypothetical protein [Verrucomicrobiales bacterium]
MSRRKRHFISWSAAVLMMSAVFYNWARIWLCFHPSGTEYEVVRLDLTRHYQEKSADQFFAAAEKIIRKPVDEWIFPENRKIQFLDRIAGAPGSTRGMEFGSLTNSWKPRFDNPVEWVTYHRIEPWRKALYINAARKLARDPEFSVDAFHRLREAEERGFFSRRELDRLSIEIASTVQEVELLNEREYDSYRQWGTYRDDWSGPLEYLARRAYEEYRREWIDDLVLAKREPDRASQKLKMLGELYFCDEADFLENFLKSNGAWLKKSRRGNIGAAQ